MDPLSTQWRLKVTDPKKLLDWETQYTGFDPTLDLPNQLDDTLAKQFLLAFARFEDAVEFLNNGSYRDRPADKTYAYFRNIEKTARSNSISGVIKRAHFNTNVLDDRRGGFLENYIEYLFSESDNFKALTPKKPKNYGGTKAEQKIHREKEKKALEKFKRKDSETWENYTERFLKYCDGDSQISPAGFIQWIAGRIKVQYVEPWLIYIGQSIDDLKDAAESHQAPEEITDYILRLEEAYKSSGLEQCVKKIRELAISWDTPPQIRIIITLPEAKGAKHHIKRVGGLLTPDGPAHNKM